MDLKHFSKFWGRQTSAKTKQKYQDELKRKMETSLEKAWNNDLLLQEKRFEKRQKKVEDNFREQLDVALEGLRKFRRGQKKVEANIREKLKAALKRQRELKKERKIMDDRFKKFKVKVLHLEQY